MQVNQNNEEEIKFILNYTQNLRTYEITKDINNLNKMEIKHEKMLQLIGNMNYRRAFLESLLNLICSDDKMNEIMFKKHQLDMIAEIFKKILKGE